MKKEEITTKAAKCPHCKNYHLIASIASFDSDKDTRKEFADLLVEGFDIIETTTEDAKAKFGFCQN